MWRNRRLFLLWVGVGGFLLSSCRQAPSRVEEVDRLERKKIMTIAPLPQIEEEKFLYASHDKRDPFVPLVDKRGRPVAVVEGGLQFKISDLFLEGIIWDETKPLAIINDEIVGCGDKISGVTVLKIEKDKVILNYQNESFELKIE